MLTSNIVLFVLYMGVQLKNGSGTFGTICRLGSLVAAAGAAVVVGSIVFQKGNRAGVAEI